MKNAPFRLSKRSNPTRQKHSREEACSRHRFDLLIRRTTLLELPPVLANITVEPWNSQLETVRGIPWTLKPRNCIAASEMHRRWSRCKGRGRTESESAERSVDPFPCHAAPVLHKIQPVNKLAGGNCWLVHRRTVWLNRWLGWEESTVAPLICCNTAQLSSLITVELMNWFRYRALCECVKRSIEHREFFELWL